MSTSRFGDAEWGEQFEPEDDPIVTIGQADGADYGDTSYLDEEFRVAGNAAETSVASAASDASEDADETENVELPSAFQFVAGDGDE